MPDQEPPQQLDYATPQSRPHRNPWRLIALVPFLILALAGLYAVLTSTIGSPFSRPLIGSDHAMCASNMHQIGLAISLYQNDHAGSYPNALEELFEEQILPSVFICPGSKDIASTGATTQAIAADFHATGHLSYIYLGKGLTDKTVADDMVVLYEPLTNHGGFGMNILFGDGHAEWFNPTIGKQVIAAAAIGQRVKINGSVVSTAPIAATQPQVK